MMINLNEHKDFYTKNTINLRIKNLVNIVHT